MQETKSWECTCAKPGEENCTVKFKNFDKSRIKLKQVQEANKRLSRKSNSMHKKSWSEYIVLNTKEGKKVDCHRRLWGTVIQVYPGFYKGVSKWGCECSITAVWTTADCSIRVFRSS